MQSFGKPCGRQFFGVLSLKLNFVYKGRDVLHSCERFMSPFLSINSQIAFRLPIYTFLSAEIFPETVRICFLEDLGIKKAGIQSWLVRRSNAKKPGGHGLAWKCFFLESSAATRLQIEELDG